MGYNPELSFKSKDDFRLAFWDGHCEYPDPWFAYDSKYGAIDTKNPDEPIMEKMIQMAARLNAKVQGDNLEVYRSPSDYYHEEDEDVSKNKKTQKTHSIGSSWWKRLFGSS